MRSFSQSSRLLLSVLISTNLFYAPFATAADPQSRRTTAKKAAKPVTYQQVLSEARNNVNVGQWLYSYEGSMVRHNIDLAVANLLETDPDARVALAAAIRDLDAITNDSAEPLEFSAARSSEDLNPEYRYRKILQKMARAHGFTNEAVKESILWTAMGSVNAFTFSALHDRLLVVVYKDLLRIMTDGEMEAVFAHELGHIHMKHVLTGIVVQSVFDAVGRNLIPEEQQGAYLALVGKESRAMIKSAIDYDGPAADHLADVLAEHAATIGAQITKRLGPAGLQRLANSFSNAFGRGDLVVNGQVQGVDKMLSAATDPNSAKSFKADMTVLTRSQEATADRWAIITAGPKNFADSMAVLTGGEGQTGEFIMTQAKQALARAGANRIDMRTIENGSHPQTVLRVASAYSYAQTASYAIMSDPFLKALDMQTKMQIQIASEHDTLNKNQIEVVLADSLAFDAESLRAYSNRLREPIVTEILNEVIASKDQSASLEKVSKLFRYLNELAPDALKTDKHYGDPGSVVFELSQKLTPLAPTNKLAQAIVDQLSSILILKKPLVLVLDKLRASLPAVAVSCEDFIK